MTQNSDQTEKLGSLLKGADRMLVLVDGEKGVIVEIFLYDGSDEPIDDAGGSSKEELAARMGDWTCLRKCLQ